MATQMDQMKKDFENVNDHLSEMRAILKKKELVCYYLLIFVYYACF